MALRTKADLQKMDYAFQGQPFVEVPAKDSIILTTMDYAFQGEPFVTGIALAAVAVKKKNVIFMGTNF